jgi:hypothetical protein
MFAPHAPQIPAATEAQQTGYNIKRNEFEPEWDAEAETIISELADFRWMGCRQSSRALFPAAEAGLWLALRGLPCCGMPLAARRLACGGATPRMVGIAAAQHQPLGCCSPEDPEEETAQKDRLIEVSCGLAEVY